MALLDITGFVLAGGKSTRMGRDKAVLQLEGRTLLELALSTLRQVCSEVMVLGPRELYTDFGAEVVEDIFSGCGPLSGIHGALSRTRTEFNLIIAVDTPFLSADFLRFMAERAMDSGAVVTTPEIAGYRQPLCSVYSREFLPIAEAALRLQRARRNTEESQPHAADGPRWARIRGDREKSESGIHEPGAAGVNSAPAKSREYKIVPLFPADRTCIISEEEMRRFAFTPEMFENLNTPDDLERARRRTAAEPAS